MSTEIGEPLNLGILGPYLSKLNLGGLLIFKSNPCPYGCGLNKSAKLLLIAFPVSTAKLPTAPPISLAVSITKSVTS